jgi:N-acetylglucosamine kinase
MTAIGIDLGGTKIEAQVFDASWARVAAQRIDTPGDYPGLLAAMADQIAWAEGQAGHPVPVGIAAAGLVNPATGLAYAANLAAMGHPFPADIDKAVGRHVTYVNDCRALTLSEAIFGAARGMSPAVGLILGTGIGGGVAVGGRLVEGPATLGGEFGHFAIAAAPVVAHGLPIILCGCGRAGCTETLIAGPGIARLAKAMTGRALTAPQITADRVSDPELARVWAVWCELVAEMLKTITFVVDPACIVIGGGMSQAPGLIADLTTALRATQLPGFAIPDLRLAQGGDASGARGAAYAAWQEAGSHG